MHYHAILYKLLYLSYKYGVVSVMSEKCAFSDSNFLEDFLNFWTFLKMSNFHFFKTKV